MIIALRLKELMAQRELSQSELARRVGVTQTTIRKLVSGTGYGSKYLHLIARELRTTPAYLTGETDDSSEDAPVPPVPARHQTVTLAVLLPTERALARMFAGLLRPFELEREDELARTLARQLPKGLQQLRGPLTDDIGDDRVLEGAEALASDRLAPRRATRT